MSVDTAKRRFSMLNFGEGSTLYLLFKSDGAVNNDDRVHLLDLYNGFVLSGFISALVHTDMTINTLLTGALTTESTLKSSSMSLSVSVKGSPSIQ